MAFVNLEWHVNNLILPLFERSVTHGIMGTFWTSISQLLIYVMNDNCSLHSPALFLPPQHEIPDIYFLAVRSSAEEED